MSEPIAVYPGTFDPPTYGHIDVINIASKIFAKLIVAVSTSRQSTTFTAQQRLQMLEDVCQKLSSVQVAVYDGLTVNFAKRVKATAIIRGIRSSVDYEQERNMAIANANLAPQIPTMLVMPSPQFSHISSTLVKEISNLGGNINHLVPTSVANWMDSRP